MNLTDTVELKKLFLSEKIFLSKLYNLSVSQPRKIINKALRDASDKQLSIIIIILHKVVQKEIMFYKKYYRRLRRSRAEPMLDELSTKKATHQLLRSSRKEILVYISNFAHLLPGFLYYLFHKKE